MSPRPCGPRGSGISGWAALKQIGLLSGLRGVREMEVQKRVNVRVPLFIIAVAVLLIVNASAQQEKERKPVPQDEEAVRLRTTLVQVPVVVSERGGRYVSDLTRDEFTVFEDGIKQDIELFGDSELVSRKIAHVPAAA